MLLLLVVVFLVFVGGCGGEVGRGRGEINVLYIQTTPRVVWGVMPAEYCTGGHSAAIHRYSWSTAV